MVSLFSEAAGYITIGDEYDKKAPKDPRNEGLKCFVTGSGKKGNLPQTTFGWNLYASFNGLSEGDEYKDPGWVEKQSIKEKNSKFIGNGPFKGPSPGKQSCGLGGYFGCFGQGVRHETEYSVIQKGEHPPKKEPEQRNIVIGPCKKGTYGVPGTLLSNSQGGANSDWEGCTYICDPFDNPKKLEQKAREKDRAMLAEKVPFKSACKNTKFFDESGNCGASQVYRLKQPLQPRKPVASTTPPPKDSPWKPSHKGKSGVGALFGNNEAAFPPYREDPFEIKEATEKEERARDRPRFGTWRPVSISKSLPVKSIEFGRVLN